MFPSIMACRPSHQPKTIFASSVESPWVHLFDKVDETPPLLPPRNADKSARGVASPRRQTMTAREINTFDEMFSMIFGAVQSSSQTSPGDPKLDSKNVFTRPTSRVHHFFRPHRESPESERKLQWNAEMDQQLDLKKEEMDLCDTDQELLGWAMRDIFGEPERHAEAAQGGTTPQTKKEATPDTTQPTVQPEIYPFILAYLMRAFRDKYHDPHLALVMFDHARQLSISSYVYGCSTVAYNELIETRWSCFRDLKGVHDALEEMNVNGVDPDSRTRMLVESIRRQVGERNLWEDEHEMEEADVFSVLSSIEALAAKGPSKGLQKRRKIPAPELKPKKWNMWKYNSEPDDGWEFDAWDVSKNATTEPKLDS
jgi:hypothetical protein